jgi:cytochrome b subunit of formate dehydrogenase
MGVELEVEVMDNAQERLYHWSHALLEILSYVTTMFAIGMQLLVACNYARFFMQLKWIFTPFLGVYTTMVQL